MQDQLGSGLRSRRQARGLSLRSVATAVGISASMLSQVETGKIHPSVSTLFDLAGYLEVSVDSLLGLPSEAPSALQEGAMEQAVQRHEDAPQICIQDGVTWERLAPAVQTNGIEAKVATYEPGASSSVDGKLSRHVGKEFGYILEGEITLQLGFEVETLRAGDSFCFDPQLPHLFKNNGESSVRGIWYLLSTENVISDPSQSSSPLRPDIAQALRALQTGA